ncbi:MAG: peptidoglycan-binding domain-containing protein [Deltaproteobacteria bacterium]|nr:peptidoglycan-binding domain-containing protein [Myxococcales bacterium]MDP3219765.1 peptidoglycan-binding domain-containing protein [Deltaproteobacteria bacterium]
MTGGALTRPERIAAGLARAPLAPAVVVTVYPSGSMASTLAGSRPVIERLMRVAAPGDLAVCIHDPITGDERALTGMVRDLGLRLWVAWGANPHVRTARTKGPASALDVCARWSKAAAALGAEVLELNGERSGSDNPNDWVIDAPGDAALLPALATNLIATVREAAPAARVSWTSHDAPRWHRLPWAAILGPGGADLHGPQIYPANAATPGQESVGAARARLAMATGQWQALVTAGTIRADVGPGGAGWCAYTQAHGVSVAGVALILDSSDTSRAWALPTRSDTDGIAAIEAVLTARRLHGRSAGAIKRAQVAAGLAVDGVLGPRTLAALGLA